MKRSKKKNTRKKPARKKVVTVLIPPRSLKAHKEKADAAQRKERLAAGII